MLQTIVTIIILAGSSFANTTTAIVNTKETKKILIGDEAKKVLKKWDPDFVVYDIDAFPATVVNLFKEDAANNLPMAVLADFNGDQKQDIALLGFNQKKNKEKVIILVAKDKSYQVVEVREKEYIKPTASSIETENGTEYGLSFYLSMMKSSELKFKNNLTSKYKPDALQLENYAGQTSAYYLKPNSKKSFDIKEYKGLVE